MWSACAGVTASASCARPWSPTPSKPWPRPWPRYGRRVPGTRTLPERFLVFTWKDRIYRRKTVPAERIRAQYVRPPDWDEFRRLQDVAGGHIRVVTLAPEQEGALSFIERLAPSGVVVALGHTAANGTQIRAAVAAGARLSTHLGNGCHAMLPRHDNPIWEQLAADELWASLICDGHHLPPAVIRCLLRVKTPARAILTCDAGSLAGLPPGRYREWDQEFEVHPAGKIVLPGTTYLAGSWVFTDGCLGPAIRFGGVSLSEALDMAGARPRELLGLPAQRLEVGQSADLVLFEWEPGRDVQVVRTVLGGKLEKPGAFL